MSTHGVKIEEFKPLLRNTLRGFVRVQLASGMVLHDVAIHQSNGSAWASPASKPRIGRDGAVIRDSAGKTQYDAVVTFASRELRDRFSSAVIEALRSAHPEALANGH